MGQSGAETNGSAVCSHSGRVLLGSDSAGSTFDVSNLGTISMSDLIVYGKTFARDTLRPDVYANGRTQVYVSGDPVTYAVMVCDVMSLAYSTPEAAIESISDTRPLSTAVVAELARLATHHGGTV